MKKTKNDSTPFYLDNIRKKYSTTTQNLKVNINCHIPENQASTITFIAINEEAKQNLHDRCSNKLSDCQSY